MDDDQQFCLRWNNHQSTLVSVFDTLLEKGIHVDCTLAAEGQTLKAHKVVLSACSPYFENVLSQQYDKHPIIILKDVKYAELRAMMDYMYRGEVNISQDQLAALLKAAESLQIKGLSDNKPSRPPSRPAPPTAHPPRAPSPPPQVRDGSIDSREGSMSPTRRRKKARRASTDLPAVLPTPATDATQGNGDEVSMKEEVSRDGVEDLTLDEEAEEQPSVTHNDVVRNFQWHMERSQDEIMNSNDSVRESQEGTPKDLSSILNYTKTPFPITRGYLKSHEVVFMSQGDNVPATSGYLKPCEDEVKAKSEPEIGVALKPKTEIEIDVKPNIGIVQPRKKRGRQTSKKVSALKTQKKGNKKCDKDKVAKYLCSICNEKKYKYRRNKLRHEKYECNTGPQFTCGDCGKRYSQKKTLAMHVLQKHIKSEKVEANA